MSELIREIRAEADTLHMLCTDIRDAAEECDSLQTLCQAWQQIQRLGHVANKIHQQLMGFDDEQAPTF